MSKPLILTTPKGKAEWPHLVEPDVACEITQGRVIGPKLEKARVQ